MEENAARKNLGVLFRSGDEGGGTFIGVEPPARKRAEMR